MKKHRFPYEWTLKDANFTKDKGTVFSCFACGGGSTMGYKLAGFDVLGCNEIDPKMIEAYKTNHNPKFAFLEPIQTFKDRKDLPKELYNLDILDGSPPCSSFSMAGNREKDWGEEKKFREGQADQVLDTLFFDFIDLAKELQPKVVVAENVSGLMQGAAKEYVIKIHKALLDAGYQLKIEPYLLDSSTMGVPQKRKRVFFIAIRNDLSKKFMQQIDMFQTIPMLNMEFKEKEITFSEIEHDGLNDFSWTDHDQYIWNHRCVGDWRYADTLKRIENRDSNFNAKFIYHDRPVTTIVSSDGSKLTLFNKPRRMNSIEVIRAGSFPSDYNFCSKTISNIKYLIGMSVPPVMVAQIATEIHNQWLSKL